MILPFILILFSFSCLSAMEKNDEEGKSGKKVTFKEYDGFLVRDILRFKSKEPLTFQNPPPEKDQDGNEFTYDSIIEEYYPNPKKFPSKSILKKCLSTSLCQTPVQGVYNESSFQDTIIEILQSLHISYNDSPSKKLFNRYFYESKSEDFDFYQSKDLDLFLYYPPKGSSTDENLSLIKSAIAQGMANQVLLKNFSCDIEKNIVTINGFVGLQLLYEEADEFDETDQQIQEMLNETTNWYTKLTALKGIKDLITLTEEQKKQIDTSISELKNSIKETANTREGFHNQLCSHLLKFPFFTAFNSLSQDPNSEKKSNASFSIIINHTKIPLFSFSVDLLPQHFTHDEYKQKIEPEEIEKRVNAFLDFKWVPPQCTILLDEMKFGNQTIGKPVNKNPNINPSSLS